jgi:hypothetical protein
MFDGGRQERVKHSKTKKYIIKYQLQENENMV